MQRFDFYIIDQLDYKTMITVLTQLLAFNTKEAWPLCWKALLYLPKVTHKMQGYTGALPTKTW